MMYAEDYQKAGIIMQQCLDKFFKGDGFNIKVEVNMDKIWITEYEDKFANGKSMMMCGVFERIFVLTGFYPCAIRQDTHQGKEYLQLTMHHKDAFESVNKKGEYWDEQTCTATCPKCGATKPFESMKYDPKDRRDMICPDCGNESGVYSYYNEKERNNV